MELNINLIIPYEMPKFNEYPIKIINLKHRTDRKEAMIKKLKEQNIENYEITEAIYGKEIDFNKKVIDLFKDNDFNYHLGIIGCTYSHINLFYNLVNSSNDYYIIFEDDVIFCNNFKEKLEYVLDLFLKSEYEYLNLSEIFSEKEFANGEKNSILLEKNNKNNITYAYIIKKNSARKILNYIIDNPIKCAPDNKMAYTFFLNSSTTNKKIVHSDVYGINNNFDSDIQVRMSRIDRIKIKKIIRNNI